MKRTPVLLLVRLTAASALGCCQAILVVFVVFLFPALAMTGEVTLSGRVLDEKGKPVKAADVRAHLVCYVKPPRVGYEWIRNWQVATDAEGRYKLEGMQYPEEWRA